MNVDAVEVDGFVLVGGASSRMGRDKSQLFIDGRRLYERAISALKPVCASRVSLVGVENTNVGIETDVTLIADMQIADKCGFRAPLLGLNTALTKATTPWIAILACDLPFVTSDLMIKLASCCEEEFDAVVPIQPDSIPQPLCAFYRHGECLQAAKEMLRTRDFKLQHFLSRIAVRYVKFEEIADLAGSNRFFLNVNTPEDYATAIRLAHA